MHDVHTLSETEVRDALCRHLDDIKKHLKDGRVVYLGVAVGLEDQGKVSGIMYHFSRCSMLQRLAEIFLEVGRRLSGGGVPQVVAIPIQFTVERQETLH